MNTPKPSDDSMKWLVRQNPQALVSSLVPDAQSDGEVDRDLQAPSVITDTFYQGKWWKKRVVLRLEFQKCEAMDQLITGMRNAGLEDLLMVGFAFSALIFPSKEDTEWLKARFFMSHDSLKDTWVFQSVHEEGVQQARKEDLLRFVELRFPTLLAQAKQAVEERQKLEQLQVLLDRLYRMNTIEEAQAVLLTNE